MLEADFLRARRDVIGADAGRGGGIGRLGERALHRILKLAAEPDETFHEVPLLGSVADIYRQGQVVEIQTRSYEKLIPKLEKFLPVASVRVVCPLAARKIVRWIDPLTGEITSGRKSPKKGTVYDAGTELYKIRYFLSHPSFSLEIVLLDMEEFRLLSGWDKSRKRGAKRAERIPVTLVLDSVFSRPSDLISLIPPQLADGFSIHAFAMCTGQSYHGAYQWIRIFTELGLLRRTEKRGRAYQYYRTFS